MNADLEKSIKAKLRAIANETHRDPGDLWRILMLERFLARLCQSSYKDLFILKGGILLSKYLEIGRETRDLDFLARKVRQEIAYLKAIFEEIAALDLKDGFIFKELQIGQLDHPHMRYSGAEIAIMGYFGKIRVKIDIDIGFGDIVEPVQKTIPLIRHSKGALFEEEVLLLCYPKESIFAEKLETIIYRGTQNSRMKDFHDLHSMISAALPFTNLKKITTTVFKHRQTPLAIPITFENGALSALQRLWSNYLTGLRTEDADTLPQNIAEILHKLNRWLQAHLDL
jgi:predicted nucleotidyltransferase component of viral defense system